MPTAEQRKKGVTTEKFDSCLAKTGNNYALCNSAFNRMKKSAKS